MTWTRNPSSKSLSPKTREVARPHFHVPLYPTLPARCSPPKEKKKKCKERSKKLKTKRNTPIRREGEPFSRIEEKHFLHVIKATTRVDGSPGISVRTLVAK